MRKTINHVALAAHDQAERDTFKENHDCTVVALAAAIDIPYGEAHDMLAKAGRKPRHGFKMRQWLNNQCYMAHLKNTEARLGHYRFTRVRMDCTVTLAQFLRDFPRGRFLACKRGHIFFINNGAVLNLWQGARTRITNLWYIEREECLDGDVKKV